MNTRLALGLCVLLCGFAASCQPSEVPKEEPATSDPIAAIGHGAFIGPDGRQLTPDRALIQKAQTHYIRVLRARLGKDREYRETRSFIHGIVEDEILADALLIDWLIQEAQPDDRAYFASKSSALRWHYWFEILGRPPPGETWSKGVPQQEVDGMEDRGVPVMQPTEAEGAAYIEQCREAGVPVPWQVLGEEWVRVGEIEDEFIEKDLEADLWLHTSEAPTGLCLALPRWDENGITELLGVICFGERTNKACFFDLPQDQPFRRGATVDLEKFWGGARLAAATNMAFPCTDCHAGRNPYVVHPDAPAFAGLLGDLRSSDWYEPIVHASWPQNPGPSDVLEAIPSTGDCTSCHNPSRDGSFPEVSQLPGYCASILEPAVGAVRGVSRTMPRSGDPGMFTNHVNALLAACYPTPGNVGIEVDATRFPDDSSNLPPPSILEPLHECGTEVAVVDGYRGLEVEVFVNDDLVASAPSTGRLPQSIRVPELKADDLVEVRHRDGTVESRKSDPKVKVIDHSEAFPDGLDPPEIDPATIFQCGSTIRVVHVPNANVTVTTLKADGTTETARRETHLALGKRVIRPLGRGFELDDEFTATQDLCGDTSPPSASRSPGPAPRNIAPPTFLERPYPGQEMLTIGEIVFGARFTVSERTAGVLRTRSWPIATFRRFDVTDAMGRPVSATDEFSLSQELCPAATPPPTSTGMSPHSCDDLPAPRFREPIEGDDYVLVTWPAAGARFRVYDAARDELFDGYGERSRDGRGVVLRPLSRPLASSDTITVVQQIGECASAYQSPVRRTPTGVTEEG